jgi:hypothetical protein
VSSGGACKTTVLHRFAGASTGKAPYAGLTCDRSGTLYGTTSDFYDNAAPGP